MSVKTDKSKNKDKSKKKKQAETKTSKDVELEKTEVKEATKTLEEKRPKKRKLDDVDSESSKPKSILKKKKKKQKESLKTGTTKKGADDDDDIADEVLEQIAVDEDKAPLENPSFRPNGDGAEGVEGADGQSSSPSLKKKKEKMRAKKVEKRAKKASAQEKKTNSEGEEIRVLEAKEYLAMWKRDKDSWKFNKTKQTWLLKNMFHEDALDDSSFSILVDYLRPLKGKAREETIKQAEAKVNEDGVDFLQAERARVIVQMLA